MTFESLRADAKKLTKFILHFRKIKIDTQAWGTRVQFKQRRTTRRE